MSFVGRFMKHSLCCSEEHYIMILIDYEAEDAADELLLTQKQFCSSIDRACSCIVCLLKPCKNSVVSLLSALCWCVNGMSNVFIAYGSSVRTPLTMDGDSQTGEAEVCSPSVLPAEISSMWQKRNWGCFNQETVERFPTAGDSFRTTCFHASGGLDAIPMWREEVLKTTLWLFSTFKTVKVKTLDGFL